MTNQRTIVEVFRLPAQNNQPHRWHWAVFSDSKMVGAGQSDSKKDALTRVQETLKSLESE